MAPIIIYAMLLQKRLLFKDCLNFCHHKVNRHMVLAAFWYDDVGITLRRFYELIMHRTDDTDVLFDDGIYGTAAFFNITGHPAKDPQVCVRIDI